MASALELETEQKCTICLQIPTEPRTLPGCSHSFCENCILIFVLNLQKENLLESVFQCPVCKMPSQVPEDNNITIDWVRTMASDSKTAKEEEKTEAHDDYEWCSQCRYLNRHVKPDFYCFTCDRSFCGECSKMLHAFEVNRNHFLISSNEANTQLFHKEALNLLGRFVKCSVHPNESLLFRCDDHGQLFCGVCFAKVHRNCRNVNYISSIKGLDAETETAISKLSAVATELIGHFNSVIGIIKEYDIEIKKTLDAVQGETHEFKQKVIRVLDALEESINQQGKALIKEIAIKNLDDIQELSEGVKSVSIVQHLLDNIVPKINPEQAYRCLHGANSVVREITNTIAGKWSTHIKLGIELKKETLLNLIQDIGVNETSQLASVKKTQTEVIMPVFHEADMNLAKLVVEKRGMETIIPKGMNYEKDPQPTYNDLVFLENGSFLITDSYNGHCCMVDANMSSVGSYSEYVVPDNPDDIFCNLRYASFVNNSLFAISIPCEMKVCLVTADETLTKRCEITYEHTPMAIYVLRNDDLALSWDNPVAFGIMTGPAWSAERVYFTMDKSGRKLKSFNHMAIDEKRGKVIQPCSVDKTIFCFDFDGQPVFQYCSETLQSPKGVAVDSEGNIYACEDKLISIHILSPLGQVIHVIDKESGCPERPLAVGLQKNEKDEKVLVVTEYDEHWYNIHFFSIISKVNNNA